MTRAATDQVTVRLSRTHFPVTELGPGRRAGIWFQGCTLHCPGCMSVDTWPRRPERTVPVAALLDWLAGLGPVDGVTISGGEPTEQPSALVALVDGIHRWRAGPGAAEVPDILVFSGRDPEWLDDPAAAMLDGADAVVIGPYVQARAGTSPLRGSENQVLVPLTDLGRRRYAPDRLAPRGLQYTVTPEGLWLVGIPLPGQLATLEARLHERGVRLGRPSWRR